MAASGCSWLHSSRDLGASSGWNPAPPSGGLASRGQPPPTTVNGVLAGRVVDGFNREQPGAVIQVSSVDNPGQSRDVQADSLGYFIVQNLDPTKRYKLVARSRPGEAPLGGTVLAQPPNVILLIKLNDNVERETASTGQRPAAELGRVPGTSGILYEPDRGPPPTRPDAPPRLGQPQAPAAPPSRTPPPPPRPEYLTQEERLAQGVPPAARIPGPGPFPDRGTTSDPVGAAPMAGTAAVFQHQLFDLEGRPTTLASQRRKLILLDFWGTWCPACIKAMPHLVHLDRQYGPRGLQVVGIAYEEGPPSECAQRVAFVAQRQGVNYPILLGQGERCGLLRRFQVARYPTLVLLDENGQLLWRGEGLTDANKRRLDELLRVHLGD
ncbi:MAG TPA: redoxin family protein [Gemmatales bacterium]|nr:redoxin family protein [Gemmatales bacterium]